MPLHSGDWPCKRAAAIGGRPVFGCGKLRCGQPAARLSGWAEAAAAAGRSNGAVGTFIRSLGVWAVFVFAALDSVGLPASGDAAVVLAAAAGDDSLVVIVLLGFAGAVVGDQVVYWVGRLAGHLIVPRFVGADRQRRFRDGLDRHAALTLVGGRLVTAIRSEVAFSAGVAELRYARFALWNAVGCLVWAFLAVAVGHLLGSVVDVKPLLATAERWSALLTVGIVVAIGAYGAVWFWRHRRNPQSHPVRR